MQHVGSEFLNQGSSPCPLQWKCGVSALGLSTILRASPPQSKCRLHFRIKTKPSQRDEEKVGEQVLISDQSRGIFKNALFY